MSLIAGFSRSGCPILFGDLLISDKEKANAIFTFPTVANVSRQSLANGELSPCGLGQKIIMVGQNAAFAWAGEQFLAKKFIKEVVKYGLHENPSREELHRVYLDVEGPGRLILLGLFRTSREMTIFDFEAWPLDFPDASFAFFKAAGSGYGMLQDTVSAIEMRVTEGNANKLEIGIGTAMSYVTSLLVRELLDRKTLNDLFGAGYEIVHPFRSVLSKFADVTYLYWAVEQLAPDYWKAAIHPFLASKYSYRGDTLVIRSARFSSDPSARKAQIGSDELHAVAPMHLDWNPDFLVGFSPPSMNSSFTCNTFIWKKSDGSVGAFSSFSANRNRPGPIIWRNEFQQDEGVDINADFLRSTWSKIIERANNEKTGSSRS